MRRDFRLIQYLVRFLFYAPQLLFGNACGMQIVIEAVVYLSYFYCFAAASATTL
jgi:hypothetical protein